MKPIWVLAKKELRSFFDSLVAYLIIIAFLAFTGFYTWFYQTGVFFNNEASLQVFFMVSYWTVFFFIPALTMRMLAEEKRSGTLELLLTKSLSDWQVIIGKFVACLILILIALALTLPYYITVSFLGPVDHSSVITGYIGIILMSMAYISIGLFASSTTTNQIVAFLLSLFIGVFFLIIFGTLANNFSGTLGQIFSYLDISTHYESISRGVIDTKDLVYFLSITLLGLIAAETSLSKRNIVE
jgi:ABC-2 type transport system permease protein